MSLSKAHFQEHLAREGNISATDLKPVVQCGTEIIIEDKDRRREYEKSPDGGFGNSMVAGPAHDWARRHAILGRMNKRLMRGGMNHRPEDAIENY